MTIDEYYTAPSQEVFDEIQRAAISIWSEYDDTYGYASGKIVRIKDLQNVQDNAWYMVAMFDSLNQAKLIQRVSSDTEKLILNAMSTDET